MGRLIEFYVPENHKPKINRTLHDEPAQVIEFRSKSPGRYAQVTWIFPEVDSDLA